MKKKKKNLLVPVVLLVILAIAGALFLRGHIWAAGGFRSRDAALLDLRGKTLSVAEYNRAMEKMPECRILWDVPLSSGYYPSDTLKLTVASLSAEDVRLLPYFPELTVLTAGECWDYPALMEFQARNRGCTVNYLVPVCGTSYPNNTDSITVFYADTAELTEKLAYLPGLKEVILSCQLPPKEELLQLQQAYPHIRIQWPISFRAHQLTSVDTELSLTGENIDFAALTELLEMMPHLERVDLTGCGITRQELITLVAGKPECLFVSELEFGDAVLMTDAEEIDLTGQTLRSTAEVEEILPCFPNAKTVILSGCGLDYDTLEALDQRYEDIRFVWTVKVKNVEVRTDTKWFYPYKYYPEMVVGDQDLVNLRYCHDIEAIDIGHMTTVTSCDWVKYMPNIKYLILVETAITDISPLASLKQLVFLEIFTTKITDYTPLLECTALEDLNLGNTYGDPAPIMQMTWLKNLWWSGIKGSYGHPCSNAHEILPAALPNTTMKFDLNTPNVKNGWRQLDNYKAMRDLMEVFYLD